MANDIGAFQSRSLPRSAYDLMKFHPKRKFIGFLGVFSILVSAGLAFLSFHSLGFKTTFPALIFFGIFVVLIIPVIKNQVVDVRDNGIVIYNLGKGFELGSEDLFEVVRRKGGALSYRFQISPCGYYNGKLLQDKLRNFFGEFDK